MFEDSTRSVMIRWIQTLASDLEDFGRLAGAQLIQLIAKAKDPSICSAGSCNGRGLTHGPSCGITTGGARQPGRVDRRASRLTRLKANRM
jgi:hypothetical protein